MENTNRPFKFAYYLAMSTAGITLLTFVVAVLTPPYSGPLCEAGCFTYPYTESVSRFPRDYYWMFPAMILMVLYLTLVVCMHRVTATDKKHFSFTGLAFATAATLTIFADYFIQVSVIQPSLLAGETEGIALFSQYNPHGIFVVLEELGYFLMGLSFLFFAPVYSGKNKIEKAMKWTCLIAFILIPISFLIITLNYGIHREYRFELAVISIVWIELIVMGLLLTQYFKNTPLTC